MSKKNPLDPNLYSQVKGVIKSLNLDQNVLAEKLGMKQTTISKALNGGNEKTFQRIVELLETEYGVTSFSGQLEASLSRDIAEIKEELKGLREALEKGLEEIRGMVGKDIQIID